MKTYNGHAERFIPAIRGDGLQGLGGSGSGNAYDFGPFHIGIGVWHFAGRGDVVARRIVFELQVEGAPPKPILTLYVLPTVLDDPSPVEQVAEYRRLDELRAAAAQGGGRVRDALVPRTPAEHALLEYVVQLCLDVLTPAELMEVVGAAVHAGICTGRRDLQGEWRRLLGLEGT